MHLKWLEWQILYYVCFTPAKNVRKFGDVAQGDCQPYQEALNLLGKGKMDLRWTEDWMASD